MGKTFAPRLVVALVGSLAAYSVQAAIPENGMYWDSQDPGKGYVIELQNGIVSVGFYAYAEGDKEPEWYVMSGPLRDDAREVPGVTPIELEGRLPLHWTTGVVMRTSNGACINCFGNAPASSRFRIASIYFTNPGEATLVFLADSIAADEIRTFVNLKKFAFGGRVDGLRSPLMHGQWVFLDLADAGGAPVRLNFPNATTETRNGGAQLWTSESAEGYRLECWKNRHLAASEPASRDGCELRTPAGDILLSFIAEDRSLNRVDAFDGPLPLQNSGVLRGAVTWRGMRIE